MDHSFPDGRAVAPRTLIGRYELGSRLGQGGMGEVRAGRDLRLHRDVAVKVLRPEMAAQPFVRERFDVEARAAASLVHPHVVAVFDSGEDAGLPFLVMERLDGRTLANAIDEGPMEPDAVRRLGIQVLDALTAAHATGLIHRDIKPANVLAAGPGNWKVGDFGIAKSVEVTDPGLTSTGMIVGTPAYLSPERLAGGLATTRSDLYAVGVIMYEALIGRRGHGSAGSQVTYGAPLPHLDHVRPGLPTDLVAIVSRATSPDPAARFNSAHEMAAQLRDGTSSSATTPTRALPHDGGEATEVLPRPVTRPGLVRPVGRSMDQRRSLFVALAAGIVLVALIVSFSLGGHKKASTPTPSTSPTSTPVSATTVPVGGQAASTLPGPLAKALQRLQQSVQP